MEFFTELHAANICGELSRLDQGVVSGTIPGICYAYGISSYLRSKDIRLTLMHKLSSRAKFHPAVGSKTRHLAAFSFYTLRLQKSGNRFTSVLLCKSHRCF